MNKFSYYVYDSLPKFFTSKPFLGYTCSCKSPVYSSYNTVYPELKNTVRINAIALISDLINRYYRIPIYYYSRTFIWL